MKHDNDIREHLNVASRELDELMAEDSDFVGYLKLGFTSSTGRLVKIAYVLAVILTITLLFTGYKFVTVAGSEQLFWGVFLLLSFNSQVAVKLWIFSQNNRNSLAKEIRLLELRLRNYKVNKNNET